MERRRRRRRGGEEEEEYGEIAIEMENEEVTD